MRSTERSDAGRMGLSSKAIALVRSTSVVQKFYFIYFYFIICLNVRCLVIEVCVCVCVCVWYVNVCFFCMQTHEFKMAIVVFICNEHMICQ